MLNAPLPADPDADGEAVAAVLAVACTVIVPVTELAADVVFAASCT
jgi:hypothetical protein